MTSWGFWVLLFPSMFQENPACHNLLRFAPQHVWGLVALSAGGLRLVALLINGLWHRTPTIRWLTSMASILIWFLVAAAFATSPIINMGVILYGWNMLADMYSAMRAATDFIEAEAQRKLKQMSLGQLPSSKDDDSNVRRLHPR